MFERKRIDPLQNETKEKHGRAGGISQIMWVIITALVIIMGFQLVQNLNIRHQYKQAAKLAYQDEYQQALDGFKKLEDLHYKDTDAYISYCNARIAYQNGDLDGAMDDMVFAAFRSTTQEQQQKINAFWDQLVAEQAQAETSAPK